MRKLITLGLLTILYCGCSESHPQSATSLQPKKLPQQNSSTADAQQDPLIADLEKLTELAYAAEQQHDYAAAAQIWGQLQQQLTSELGGSAWQTRNAELARELAFARSQFSPEQKRTWQQIENLQLSAQQSLKSRDLQAAYNAVRQSTQLQKNLFGAESYAFSQALLQLASMDSTLGQFDQAINNFNDCLQILNQHELMDHPDRVATHAGLANAYMSQNKLKTAAANQKQATMITGSIWGKQSLELATAANQLGAIYHRAGNLPVAEELFRRSLGLREQHLGTEHQAVAHSSLNLGVVLMDGKKFDKVESSFTRAANIFLREYGAEAEITQRCYSRLASFHMLQQQPGKAEPVLRSILQSLAKQHAPDSEPILMYSYRLSIALARQGKYAEAGPLMQSTLEFQQQKFGDADSRTVATMQAYAMVLDRTKNQKPAEAIRDRIRRVADSVESNDFQRR